MKHKSTKYSSKTESPKGFVIEFAPNEVAFLYKVLGSLAPSDYYGKFRGISNTDIDNLITQLGNLGNADFDGWNEVVTSSAHRWVPE